jgi:hypothetical protein
MVGGIVSVGAESNAMGLMSNVGVVSHSPACCNMRMRSSIATMRLCGVLSVSLPSWN